MTVARSMVLFLVAAVAEIGGAVYGFVATLQPDANFGRILAPTVASSWPVPWPGGLALDGFRPDRYDLTGAGMCLIGVAVIMCTPREVLDGS